MRSDGCSILSPHTLGAGLCSSSTDCLCRHKACLTEIRQQRDQCNSVGVRYSMKKREGGGKGARECVATLLLRFRETWVDCPLEKGLVGRKANFYTLLYSLSLLGKKKKFI